MLPQMLPCTALTTWAAHISTTSVAPHVKLGQRSEFKLTHLFSFLHRLLGFIMFLDLAHKWPWESYTNQTHKGRNASQKWPFRWYQSAVNEDTTEIATVFLAFMDGNHHCQGSYIMLLFQKQSRLTKITSLTYLQLLFIVSCQVFSGGYF